MRIGLYGGTFDPIHLGHLRAAETAREGAGLDVVAFLPSAVPPHRGAALSAAADRLAMARLATASQPRFEAWDTELRRPGPSYTVETVQALLAARPSDVLFLVVGTDTWPEMTTWREPERLLSLVEVVVVDRPGYPAPPPTAPFPSARGVRRADGPSLPISATAVRERVHEGLSVRYLVPDPVAQYIAERGLYR
ncbi:MAG TPA: nicotinate-nucleotide adenylyltransferase [Vicinamibacteria bacterium]|nr:nicotinate-nucleotide adenylyltransferase [Vicinamibacteria bacterium]